MINRIQFKNYKSFKENQVLKLKPITILIGKNNSGKSAVAKLLTMIEGSLSGEFEEPILVNNNNVELGAEYRDLVYGKEIGSLEFILENDVNKLSVEVVSSYRYDELPRIRKWKLNNDIDLRYVDKEKYYHDEVTDRNFNCAFSGFNLDLLLDKSKDGSSEDSINLFEKDITLKTNYIGPFRETPKRTYSSIGNIRAIKLGNKGENAYPILISDYLYKGGKLLVKVCDWYKNNFEGWGIEIDTKTSPYYKIELSRSEPQFNINLCDVGQGTSQALPLVVSALMDPPNEILTIIEQPELHLHPGAHGNLAELFAESTMKSKNKFLIETHSQNFVLRLRRMIVEGRYNKENISIYYVDYNDESNTSELKEIIVNDLGEVSYWPENVFRETLDETIAIKTAQLNKDKNGN